LKRAREGLLANYVFGGESVHGLADSIAQGVTIADLDWLKGYLTRVQAVTAADVQRVAKKYLDPEKRVTVWSVPGKPKLDEKEKKEQGAAPSPHPPPPEGRGASLSSPPSPRGRGAGGEGRALAEGAGAAGLSLKDAKRVELPNGLVLLLLENHRL